MELEFNLFIAKQNNDDLFLDKIPEINCFIETEKPIDLYLDKIKEFTVER